MKTMKMKTLYKNMQKMKKMACILANFILKCINVLLENIKEFIYGKVGLFI